MSTRQSRAATAAALAPVAPPCFSSKDQWIEYVSWCAIDQRSGHAPGPLVLEPGEPVRFNPAFDVCGDCNDRYARAMQRTGKCRPKFLIDLFAAQAAKETA